MRPHDTGETVAREKGLYYKHWLFLFILFWPWSCRRDLKSPAIVGLVAQRKSRANGREHYAQIVG